LTIARKKSDKIKNIFENGLLVFSFRGQIWITAHYHRRQKYRLDREGASCLMILKPQRRTLDPPTHLLQVEFRHRFEIQ
jgi:hypothetical protein